MNEALALLKFTKKHAAKQIEKMLQVGRGERASRRRARERARSTSTQLYVKTAIVNEGPPLKRFMPAAMGRATPIHKRTSHVEILVATKEAT